MVWRTHVVRELGGFDEAMRLGEDVDLVWRVAAAGHRCRYEPTSVVHHEPRGTAERAAAPAVRLRPVGRAARPPAPERAGTGAHERVERRSSWLLLVARHPLLAHRRRRRHHRRPAAQAHRRAAARVGSPRRSRPPRRRPPVRARDRSSVVADRARRCVVCRRARLPVVAALVAPRAHRRRQRHGRRSRSSTPRW